MVAKKQKLTAVFIGDKDQTPSSVQAAATSTKTRKAPKASLKVMISKASKTITESTNSDVDKPHKFDKVPTVLPNLSQFLKWALVCCHINHAASH